MASRSGRRGEFSPESKLIIESAMQLVDDASQQELAGPHPRRKSRSFQVNLTTAATTAKSNPKITVPTLVKKPSSSSNTDTTSPKNRAGVLKDDDGCMVCHRDVDHANLLLCEACNDEYHTYCLNPPLQSVPEGDFFCGEYYFTSTLTFSQISIIKFGNVWIFVVFELIR